MHSFIRFSIKALRTEVFSAYTQVDYLQQGDGTGGDSLVGRIVKLASY